MAESPDFLRNQDFFCTFVSNILLAVFLTQPLTQTGRGAEIIRWHRRGYSPWSAPL